MQPALPSLDGRQARSLRTRDAVVRALIDLIEAGDLRPTARAVAGHAGVSERSVFQHFADLETLFAAAADHQVARFGTLAGPPSGSFRERLSAFISRRAEILEAITPVRRAALLYEPFSDEISSRLARSHETFRRQVQQAFAPELTRRPSRDRAELLEALACLTSWASWETLRRTQRLSPGDARNVMTRMLEALLKEDA